MKHHASTYVTVPFREGEAGLRDKAAERLGGHDGLKCVSMITTGTDDAKSYCGTFTRDWETEDVETSDE